MFNAALAALAMGFAWDGNPRAFYSHPARLAAVALLIFPSVAVFAFTSGSSAGVRQAGESRVRELALSFVANLGVLAVIYLESRGLWVLPGGDRLRYTGLALLLVGSVLRTGPMLALGRRFSLQVAVQQDHALETRGWYERVRHPSYLGLLLMLLGAVGVFRSVLALLLFPLTVWSILRRIRIEEEFLGREFGDSYRAYAARTARLLPGVY